MDSQRPTTRAGLQREKLLGAIVFFAKETRRCHKLKLFKLLFFLDSEVFRKTGRTTTGLGYFAWPMGPVPNALFNELDSPGADLGKAVLITSLASIDPAFGKKTLQFKPRGPFDNGPFSSLELAEMKRLAEVYREADADAMTGASHIRGGPWDTVYRIEKRPQAIIPFELALDARPDSVTEDQVQEIALEDREFAALFG